LTCVRSCIKMSFGSFTVGLLSSTVFSIVVLEKLRDRKLLCEHKFDEGEVNSYLYNMKLKNLIDATKEKRESAPTADARRFVNENIVKNLRNSFDTVFSEGEEIIKKVKKMIGLDA